MICMLPRQKSYMLHACERDNSRKERKKCMQHHFEKEIEESWHAQFAHMSVAELLNKSEISHDKNTHC